VKMIACPSWPAAFSPLRNVFELINKVKAWLAEHEQSQGPVIVVDKFVCFNVSCLSPTVLYIVFTANLSFVTNSCSITDNSY